MGILLQDTFTGTDGTMLVAHSPEIGGAWLHPSDPFNEYLMVLSGGAAARNAYTQPYESSHHYNALLIPPRDHEVVFEFELRDPATTSQYELSLTIHGASADDHIRGTITHYGTTIDAKIGAWGVNWDFDTLGGATGQAITAGPHILKMTAVGDVYSLYYDDILLVSHTTASYPDGGMVGFMINNSWSNSPGDVAALSITVNGEVVLVPFWTNLHGQRETV